MARIFYTSCRGADGRCGAAGLVRRGGLVVAVRDVSGPLVQHQQHKERGQVHQRGKEQAPCRLVVGPFPEPPGVVAGVPAGHAKTSMLHRWCQAPPRAAPRARRHRRTLARRSGASSPARTKASSSRPPGRASTRATAAVCRSGQCRGTYYVSSPEAPRGSARVHIARLPRCSAGRRAHSWPAPRPTSFGSRPWHSRFRPPWARNRLAFAEVSARRPCCCTGWAVRYALAEHPGQRVEVRELPGKENVAQQRGRRIDSVARRGPALSMKPAQYFNGADRSVRAGGLGPHRTPAAPTMMGGRAPTTEPTQVL